MNKIVTFLVGLLIGTAAYSQVVYSYHSPENKGNYTWEKYTIRFSEDTQTHIRWGSLLYQIDSVQGIFQDDFYAIPYSDLLGIKEFLTFAQQNLMGEPSPNGDYLTFQGKSVWMTLKAKGKRWDGKLATYDTFSNSNAFLLNFYISKQNISGFLNIIEEVIKEIDAFVGDKGLVSSQL